MKLAERWWQRLGRRGANEILEVRGFPTGVLGDEWRAVVTECGDLVDARGNFVMRWFVAADDRWHRPADEVAVRQRNVDGSAVVETRIRVPGGDVVETVWSTIASDGRRFTAVEFANESSMPVAIAVTGKKLVTARPIEPAPAPGLEIDELVRVLPVAHRTNVRVFVAHDDRAGDWPTGCSEAGEVGAGWLAVVGRAGRVSVPELIGGRSVAELVAATRCRMALESIADVADPIERLLMIDERSRMNLDQDDLVPTVIEAAELVLGRARSGGGDALGIRLALTAAHRLLRSDPRAATDLVSSVARWRKNRAENFPEAWGAIDASGPLVDSGRRLPAEVADRLVRWTTGNTATLVPDGLPRSWWGSSCEVFDLAVGSSHRVSFAIRWHGERPAVLWEISGPPGLVLRSGADENWSTTQERGEALWAAPAPVRSSLRVQSGESFG